MKTIARLVLLAGACALSSLASAHERGGRMYYDTHYHFNHYYPAQGYISAALPMGAISVGFGRDRFWFGGGVWYRPYGSSFRVIMPPIGVIIPILPSAYVSLNFGGVPYYYANGIYYTQAIPGPGYVVAAPPADASTAQTQAAPVVTAPPVSKPDPIIYPRNGQSAAQTEADRQDCNRWATTQPSAMNDASVFGRAVEACMDGRGYSMR